MVIVFMTFFLLGLLFSFIMAKNAGPQIELLFPALRDCKNIEKMFSTLEIFEAYAQIDTERTYEQQGKGQYQCYCKAHSSIRLLYDRDYEHMCYSYQSDIAYDLAFRQIIAFSVVFFNIIIQEINMFLVSKIGYHMRSEETLRVCKQLFFAQFINTAFL